MRFATVEVEGGWQSVLTCIAYYKSGAPYEWSGKEFKGDVAKTKRETELSAAAKFLKDPDVMETARTVAPASRAVGAWAYRQSKKGIHRAQH